MDRRKYSEKEKQEALLKRKKVEKYRSAVYARRARKVALNKKINKLVNKRVDKLLKIFTLNELYDLFTLNDKDDIKCSSKDELLKKIKE